MDLLWVGSETRWAPPSQVDLMGLFKRGELVGEGKGGRGREGEGKGGTYVGELTSWTVQSDGASWRIEVCLGLLVGGGLKRGGKREREKERGKKNVQSWNKSIYIGIPAHHQNIGQHGRPQSRRKT